MKILSFLSLVLVLLLVGSSTISTNASDNSRTNERGTVTFDQPVKLLGVELKGEYLFVHDDAAMMRGESCTFVYKGTVEKAKNLVVSFHCIPQTRIQATHFTVRSRMTAGTNEIEEIQFAGSAKAHVVSPLPHHYVGVVGF